MSKIEQISIKKWDCMIICTKFIYIYNVIISNLNSRKMSDSQYVLKLWEKVQVDFLLFFDALSNGVEKKKFWCWLLEDFFFDISHVKPDLINWFERASSKTYNPYIFSVIGTRGTEFWSIKFVLNSKLVLQH